MTTRDGQNGWQPSVRTQQVAVTDEDARRYIDDLEERAGRLWDAGHDTLHIAQQLAIGESRAVFLVSNHRSSRWRRA